MSFPCPVFCPEGPPTILTLVATSTSAASSSISLPTGSQEGDLCIFCETSTDGDASAPSADSPSGWTAIAPSEIIQGAAPSARLSNWYKVLTAADISAGSVTGMNGNAADFKHMMTFRSDRPIRSVDVVDFDTQVTTGNPSSQTVTPTAVPCVVMGNVRAAQGGTTGTSGTLADDGTEVTAGTNFRTKYLIQNDTPTSKTYDTGDSGTWTWLQTWVIQVG